MKKTVLLFCAAACACLFSCSRHEEYSYELSTGVEDTEPIHIAWLVQRYWLDLDYAQGFEEDQTTWYMEQIEKAFNVEIVPYTTSWVGDGHADLYLFEGQEWISSLTFPDCAYVSCVPWEAADVVGARHELRYSRGLIRSIPLEYIRKYMPGYHTYLSTQVVNWQEKTHPLKDDPSQVLGLPFLDIRQAIPTQGVAMWARWLEASGLDLGDYHETGTLIMTDPSVYLPTSSTSLTPTSLTVNPRSLAAHS